MKLPHLKAWRDRAFLTQAELATQADISEATVVRIEHGADTRAPTARKLALALGIAPGALLREPGDTKAGAAA